MTSRDHARRSTAELRGRLAERSEPAPTGPSVPERLAVARERKGVDLSRAERATKIRARYLWALERGRERDLPRAVGTQGCLTPCPGNPAAQPGMLSLPRSSSTCSAD